MKRVHLTLAASVMLGIASPATYASPSGNQQDLLNHNIYIAVPHKDDSMLTFAGFLADQQKSGHLVDKHIVVDVAVSRTNYTSVPPWDKSQTVEHINDVSALRYKEDVGALSELLGDWRNFTYQTQGLLDAPLRPFVGPYGGPYGHFADFKQPEIDMFNRLVEHYKNIIKQDDCTMLVSIANGSHDNTGISQHVDHFIVREAVITAAYRLGDEAKCHIVFGQDQPYTSYDPSIENIAADGLKQRLPANALNEITFVMPPAPDGSGDTLKLYLFKKYYKSQMDPTYVPALTNDTSEKLYWWIPSTYGDIQSYPDCNADYCRLHP